MDKFDYMKIAINEAKKAAKIGEVPVGAVVVDKSDIDNPKIIAKAHNLREKKNSPSAHAEFLAIEKASKKLGSWRLTNCEVYVTLEPCIMCAGLMHQSRISKCYFGAYDKKCGALGSLYNINSDKRLNHNFEVDGGILEDECKHLLQEFFQQRR